MAGAQRKQLRSRMRCNWVLITEDLYLQHSLCHTQIVLLWKLLTGLPGSCSARDNYKMSCRLSRASTEMLQRPHAAGSGALLELPTQSCSGLSSLSLPSKIAPPSLLTNGGAAAIWRLCEETENGTEELFLLKDVVEVMFGWQNKQKS